MCKMINQFADKIKGQFSFFDRMIINGYFRPLLSEQNRIGYLYSMGIPLRDFTEYFRNVTDLPVKQLEDSARKLECLLYTSLLPGTGKRTLLKTSCFQILWTKVLSASSRHLNPAGLQRLLAAKGNIF